MQPTFGCRLWNLAFEQNVDFLSEVARKMVMEDVASWISGVTVSGVDVTLLKSDGVRDDRDIYRLHIAISFMVDATKQLDTIELDVDSGTLN